MVRANGVIEVSESYEGFEEGTIVRVNLFKPIIE
jgi:molybdopterin biosynthesis enzyme